MGVSPLLRFRSLSLASFASCLSVFISIHLWFHFLPKVSYVTQAQTETRYPLPTHHCRRPPLPHASPERRLIALRRSLAARAAALRWKRGCRNSRRRTPRLVQGLQDHHGGQSCPGKTLCPAGQESDSPAQRRCSRLHQPIASA